MSGLGSRNNIQVKTNLILVLLLIVFSGFPLALVALPHTSIAVTSGIQLSISAKPTVLPADGRTYGAIVLQFVDTSTNLPVIPSSNVTVYLSSSNNQTGTVPQVVIYPAGALYDNASFTTTTLPGSTTIYAVAQGYQPASIKLTTQTVGGIPTSLKVFAAPSEIIAEPDMISTVVVEAVDALGNPVKLANNLPVSVYSSDTLVGNLPSALTIPAGESFLVTTFNATTNPGQTVITASTQGIASSSAIITTKALSLASSQLSLAIQFAPPVLLSDGRSFQNVIVGIVNGSGYPCPAPSATEIILTSSTASVGVIQGLVIIPPGQEYVNASFATRDLSGSTTITASASNFGSTQSTLILVTKAATALGLYAVPGTVLADNQTFNNMIVQLQDPSGNPEKTVAPVNVSLQSLYPAMGTVPSNVIIPANSTYASIPLTTTLTSGQIKIAAFATGFELGQVVVNSTLLPINIAISASQQSLSVGGSSSLSLQVMSGKFPVQNATVHWVATSGQISPASTSTNGSGYSRALVVAKTTQPSIVVNARVSAPGFAPHTVATTLVISSTQHQSGILGVLTMKVFFIPLYVPIAAGAVAGGGFAFFFIRKRFASSDEESEEEE